MNTQHIGDGPPWEEHFYDLEDEETNRATGSGHTLNAAAWDPEKMELHRIVNRLWRRGELSLPGQWSTLYPTR